MTKNQSVNRQPVVPGELSSFDKFLTLLQLAERSNESLAVWKEAPLSRVKYLAAASGGGVVGSAIGKLTRGDLKALLSQVVEGVFKFLHEQGAYASFAIVMAAGTGGLAMWAIKKLIAGKDTEISRIAEDRDKFQKLFIENWQSSISEKGAKKK